MRVRRITASVAASLLAVAAVGVGPAGPSAAGSPPRYFVDESKLPF